MNGYEINKTGNIGRKNFIDKGKVALELDFLVDALIKQYLTGNITKKNIDLKYFIQDIERRIINFTLELTNGNQKNASRILGVKETSLCEKIKKHNLKKSVKKVILNLDILDLSETEINSAIINQL